MKETVYCNAIKNGNEKEWNFAWERFKNSNVASEKSMLLDGLSCAEKTSILKR